MAKVWLVTLDTGDSLLRGQPSCMEQFTCSSSWSWQLAFV